MIALFFGGAADWDEATYARYWDNQYRLIEADRAFGRERWARRLRGLARLLGRTAEEERPEGGFLPLAAIVGFLDGRTGLLRPLPPLKRKWKEAWRRLWSVEEIDSLPTLAVIRGPGGWYLTETPSTFLLLGVLAAKGVREVRITGPGGTGACADTEASGRRASYRLVECGTSHACRDETAGVAV